MARVDGQVVHDAFVTLSTAEEHLVDDDAGPTGNDGGNPDVPGRRSLPVRRD
jgi:hypothetical protein